MRSQTLATSSALHHISAVTITSVSSKDICCSWQRARPSRFGLQHAFKAMMDQPLRRFCVGSGPPETGPRWRHRDTGVRHDGAKCAGLAHPQGEGTSSRRNNCKSGTGTETQREPTTGNRRRGYLPQDVPPQGTLPQGMPPGALPPRDGAPPQGALPGARRRKSSGRRPYPATTP